jgi:hypothetical protein
MRISMDINSFMSISRQGPLPDWEALYKTQKVETMPWYNENFDSDLEKELDDRKITNNEDNKNSLTLALVQAHRPYGLLKEDLRL